MPKPTPDVLKELAAVVLRHGIDGERFPAYVEELQDRYDRDAPAPVRHVAALVRWRKPWLTAQSVAGLLKKEAAKLDRHERNGSHLRP